MNITTSQVIHNLINNFQSQVYYHNSVWNYLLALIVFIVVLIGFKIIEAIVVSRLIKLAKYTTTDLDDIIIKSLQDLGSNFYLVVGLYLGSLVLNLASWLDKTIYAIFLIVIAYEVIHLTQIVLSELLEGYSAKQEKDGQPNKSFISMGMIFVRIVLYAVGALFILSNLGINITALAASLGVGSLAIALALQSVLGDMFSSFSIYADKPFEVGDFIGVGDNFGVVSKIGLKTTRITTLQGQELVIANKELTTVRVNNYRKMEKRRVLVDFGIGYSTLENSVEKIPTFVKDIVGKIKDIEFDRCHFTEFGDSALLFQLCYYVKSKDYAVFMDTKQELNLGLLSCFRKNKIKFAHPTRTVYIEGK